MSTDIARDVHDVIQRWVSRGKIVPAAAEHIEADLAEAIRPALQPLTPYEARALATWIDVADFEGDVAPSQIELAERLGAKVPWAHMERKDQERPS